MVESLQDGVAALAGDSTEAAGISGQTHEAAFAPVLGVRVLDDPVIPSVLRSVSNYRDRVVDLARIAGVVLVDATAVLLEGYGVGVHGAGQGTQSGNHLLHLLLVSGCNAGIVPHLNNTLTWRTAGGLVLTALHLRLGVRVFVGQSDSMIANVLEGVLLETAIASHVSVVVGAVHQVLLRERGQDARAPEDVALEGSCGGERPTGSTAHTLETRGRDSTLLPPVEFLGQIYVGCPRASQEVNVAIGVFSRKKTELLTKYYFLMI